MTSDDMYRTVMTVDPPDDGTAFDVATRRFLFGEVWNRPGLSIRDRRIVTLACVAGADAAKPIEDQVYAALRSGDLTIDEMNEITLHFAVYCGWPKGDITWDEMEEVILQFSAYYGFAKGEALHAAAQRWRTS